MHNKADDGSIWRTILPDMTKILTSSYQLQDYWEQSSKVLKAILVFNMGVKLLDTSNRPIQQEEQDDGTPSAKPMTMIPS